MTRHCNHCIDGECCFYGEIDEGDLDDCDTCPHFEEADQFAGYVDWLKSEDAKLRRFERG